MNCRILTIGKAFRDIKEEHPEISIKCPSHKNMRDNQLLAGYIKNLTLIQRILFFK